MLTVLVECLIRLVAVNDDGVVNEFDFPMWEPFIEIISGARRLSVADARAVYSSRPGRVFRRRCVLHRVSNEHSNIACANENVRLLDSSSCNSDVPFTSADCTHSNGLYGDDWLLHFRDSSPRILSRRW